jgi:hypothetical protein
MLIINFEGTTWNKCFCLIKDSQLSLYTMTRKKMIGSYDMTGSVVAVAPQQLDSNGRKIREFAFMCVSITGPEACVQFPARCEFSLNSKGVAWIFFKVWCIRTTFASPNHAVGCQ